MERLPEKLADAQKIVEAAVTPKQMLEEFGEQHYHEDEKGWRVDLKDDKGRVDMRKVRTFNEMDKARQRAETAAGEHAQSRASEVTIKGPDGKRMKVDERIAERMERKLWERSRG